MMEDVFPVLLVMLVCIPVAIMLINDIRRDKEVAELRSIVDSLRAELGEWMGVPRRFLEADLPPDIAARGGDNPNV